MKTKCLSNHRRAGRPRQDPESERKGVNHGWFVAVDGQSAKIMGMTPLDKPENYKTAIELLKGLVDVYPKIRTVVYDRACSFMQSAKKVPKLKRVKTYVVDKFHAHRHSKKCPASPLVHRRLARAIHGVNTSAAEQTFAWLRTYSKSLNSMGADSHEFLLLVFCKMHNQLVGSRWAPNLVEGRRLQKRTSKSYGVLVGSSLDMPGCME